MNSRDKKILIDTVMVTMRDMSASSLLMRQEFARRSGMNSSDAECVDFLRLNGPVLPSDIARHFGLTKGAITAMVRRLKHLGIVSTQVDTNDKRKLWISVNPDRLTGIVSSYKKLAIDTANILQDFSEDELIAINTFNKQMDVLYSESHTMI